MKRWLACLLTAVLLLGLGACACAPARDRDADDRPGGLILGTQGVEPGPTTPSTQPTETTAPLPDPPVFTKHPGPEEVLGAQSLGFTVKVEEGLAPYTYQWFVTEQGQEGEQKLEDVFSASGAETDAVRLWVPNADFLGHVWCRVTDANGSVVDSEKTKLTVLQQILPLGFAEHPAAVTVQEGGSASFSAKVSGGKAGYQYTWYWRQGGSQGVLSSGRVDRTGVTAATWSGLGAAMDGAQVWCVVTDAEGNRAETYKATVTVG